MPTPDMAPLTPPIKNVKHPTPIFRPTRSSGRGGGGGEAVGCCSEGVDNMALRVRGAQRSISGFNQMAGLGRPIEDIEEFLDVLIQPALTNLVGVHFHKGVVPSFHLHRE